jgi:hypothetical protein
MTDYTPEAIALAYKVRDKALTRAAMIAYGHHCDHDCKELIGDDIVRLLDRLSGWPERQG